MSVPRRNKAKQKEIESKRSRLIVFLLVRPLKLIKVLVLKVFLKGHEYG